MWGGRGGCLMFNPGHWHWRTQGSSLQLCRLSCVVPQGIYVVGIYLVWKMLLLLLYLMGLKLIIAFKTL